jgi:ribonuclease J
MTIEITAVGGYGEIGRNMTLVRVGKEAVALDMGIHLDRLLTYTQDEDMGQCSREDLIKHKCIPDDTLINKDEVLAIIPSHGHLDHIAAIPFLEKNYKCPMICTNYTGQVLYRQFKDNKFKKKNRIKIMGFNQRVRIGEEFEIEFIRVTHSIPQATIVVLYTKHGAVVYANDFKFDMTPVLGKAPDLEKLATLKGKTKVLISECLRAKHEATTQSEVETVKELEDILTANPSVGKAIYISTFSSHIERLHTIVKLARKLKRKVIFLGRSLEKYAAAAKISHVSNLIDYVELVKYRSHVMRRLKQLQKENGGEYIVVMTGHQAEKQAVLSNIITGKLPSPFKPDDLFIFSCHIIPTDTIEAARAELEAAMKKLGINIVKDVHVSGHASTEDLRHLLKILEPENAIPAHGEMDMMDAYEKLAKPLAKNVVKIVTGQTVTFD